MKKYETIDSEKYPLISKYEIAEVHTDYLIVSNDNKKGIINLNNKNLNTDCRLLYDVIKPLNNNTFIVQMFNPDITSVIVDKSGRELSLRYKTIEPCNGGYIIYDHNNKWGVMDDTYQEIIKPQYGNVKQYLGNYYLVQNNPLYNNDLLGLLDQNGNVLLDMIYKKINVYDDRYAVCISDKKDRQLIDLKTKKVILNNYFSIDYLSNDRWFVKQKKRNKIKRKIVDNNGKTVKKIDGKDIKYVFAPINGLVKISYNGYTSNIMNKEGEYLFEKDTNCFEITEDGLILLNQAQIYDKKGVCITKGVFNHIHRIAPNLYTFWNRSIYEDFTEFRSYNFYNYLDNYVSKDYNNIVYGSIKNRLICKTFTDKYELVDLKGNVLAEVNEIEYNGQDIYKYKLYDGWGLMDKDGESFTPDYYDEIGEFKLDITHFISNKKYGIMNIQGEEVIKPIYDFISYYDIKDRLICIWLGKEIINKEEYSIVSLYQDDGKLLFDKLCVKNIHLLNNHQVIIDNQLVDINSLMLKYHLINLGYHKEFDSEEKRNQYMTSNEILIEVLNKWLEDSKKQLKESHSSYHTCLIQLKEIISQKKDLVGDIDLLIDKQHKLLEQLAKNNKGVQKIIKKLK